MITAPRPLPARRVPTWARTPGAFIGGPGDRMVRPVAGATRPGRGIAVIAREHGGSYDPDAVSPHEPGVGDRYDSIPPRDPEDPGPQCPPDEGDEWPPSVSDTRSHDVAGTVTDGGEASVRDAARALEAAARHLVDVSTRAGRPVGGELGALTDTLAAIESAHAAAVELAGQAQASGAASRSTGLPMEHWLAMASCLPIGERRGLLATAEGIRAMPHLRQAFLGGLVGFRQVRTILIEVRGLSAEARARVDAGFADWYRLRRRDPDRLLDETIDAATAERPEREAKDTARTIERRYFALQPMLDGAGGTGYFELDDEGFAIVAEGLEAAMPPPSAGPRDVTDDAIGHADADDEESETADGLPAFCDPVTHRSRARQRADALVTLAETFLAGARPDGTTRRARPRLQALVDLTQAADPSGPVGWLLPPTVGRRPAVTAEALRRLASDADVQLVITDGDQIVGVTAPTANIPARVRAAVQARDRGCRFPGCRLPIAFTDCHHVVAREDGGHTVVSNLVALCRRHHTAVTEGRWQLDMTGDGTVTVTRGRRTATSDPPSITPFREPRDTPPGSADRDKPGDADIH